MGLQGAYFIFFHIYTNIYLILWNSKAILLSRWHFSIWIQLIQFTIIITCFTWSFFRNNIHCMYFYFWLLTFSQLWQIIIRIFFCRLPKMLSIVFILFIFLCLYLGFWIISHKNLFMLMTIYIKKVILWRKTLFSGFLSSIWSV